jgi:putative DeoR family transcriptional regulator (stage III sporulation protein D)
MQEMFSPDGGERCVQLGRCLVEQQLTVRAVAAQFGISKSTVHKDVTQTLRRINPTLYREVQRVLEVNKQERHLRGGEATKQKYLQKYRQRDPHRPA